MYKILLVLLLPSIPIIFATAVEAETISYSVFSDSFDDYNGSGYLEKWSVTPHNTYYINVSNLTASSSPNSLYLGVLPMWVKSKTYDGGNELNLSFYVDLATSDYYNDNQTVAGKYVFLSDKDDKTVALIKISTSETGAGNGSFNVYASNNSTYAHTGPISLTNLVKLYSKSKLPKSWDHFYVRDLNNTHYSIFWNNSIDQGNKTLKKNIESDKIFYVKFYTDNWKSIYESYFDDVRINFKTEFLPESVTPLWSDKFRTNYTESQPNIITLGVRWEDNERLHSVILSTNKTGSWANESTQIFSSKNIWSNYTLNTSGIPDDTIISWMLYANDTSGNSNSTGVSSFKVNPKLEKIPPVINLFWMPDKLIVLNKTFSAFDIHTSATDDSGLLSVTIHMSFANKSELTYLMSGSSATFIINSTGPQLPIGKNSFYVNATDIYGNIKLSDNVTFYIVNATESLNKELTLNESMMATIGDSATLKSILTIKLNESANNRNVSIAYYDTPINNATNWISAFGRYYIIEAVDNVSKYMSWSIIKIYYSNDEVGTVNESALRLGFYNTSSEKVELCNSPQGGVDIENNFVYCNTTHFSEWGLYPEKQIPTLTLSVSPNWNVNAVTQTTISCSANTDEVTVGLFKNGVGVSIPSIETLSAGSYSYMCNNTETLNYSSVSVSNTLTVSNPSSSSGGGIGSSSGSGSGATVATPKPNTTTNKVATSSAEPSQVTTPSTNTEPDAKVEENDTLQPTGSNVFTGFMTLVRPEFYPIISIALVLSILAMVYFYLKKSRRIRKK